MSKIVEVVMSLESLLGRRLTRAERETIVREQAMIDESSAHMASMSYGDIMKLLEKNVHAMRGPEVDGFD